MRIVRRLVCALLSVGFATAANAEVVRLPHSFISLSPPPGFRAMQGFPGFENRRAGWTIKLLELGPEVWPEYAAALSSLERANALFGPEGVRIERIEQLALDSGDVPLAIGVGRSFGTELATYIALVSEGQANPVLVMFELRRSTTLGRSDVEAVIRSVKNDTPTTLGAQVAALPFTFRESPPFHTALAASGPTPASFGVATLAAFDDADQSEKTLTIQIRWTPTDVRVGTAQTNASLIHGALNTTEATIVEQRAAQFAGGQGDFIVASAGGRTALQFLRVLPDDTQVMLSAAGESRAMESAREAVMAIASAVELRN